MLKITEHGNTSMIVGKFKPNQKISYTISTFLCDACVIFEIYTLDFEGCRRVQHTKTACKSSKQQKTNEHI